MNINPKARWHDLPSWCDNCKERMVILSVLASREGCFQFLVACSKCGAKGITLSTIDQIKSYCYDRDFMAELKEAKES